MSEPRMLILGATGMLGHVLLEEAVSEGFDAVGTIRGERLPAAVAERLDPKRIVAGVPATDAEALERALAETGAEVAVNCIGVVKQAPEGSDPVASIAVNSLYPHRLAALCREREVRLIHLSTDCVFSGRAGGYDEDAEPDPVDLYGRSKLLGEVGARGCLTLRTSMVGRELTGANGLVEWFLSQRGAEVRGYRRAIFSGLTTRALARAICELAANHPGLEGIRHLSAETISKHDLLALLHDAMGADVRVVPDDSVAVDRSLDSHRLREATGWSPPGWAEMIEELAADAASYEQTRRVVAGG